MMPFRTSSRYWSLRLRKQEEITWCESSWPSDWEMRRMARRRRHTSPSASPRKQCLHTELNVTRAHINAPTASARRGTSASAFASPATSSLAFAANIVKFARHSHARTLRIGRGKARFDRPSAEAHQADDDVETFFVEGAQGRGLLLRQFKRLLSLHVPKVPEFETPPRNTWIRGCHSKSNNHNHNVQAEKQPYCFL
jgi:hypothetical protein